MLDDVDLIAIYIKNDPYFCDVLGMVKDHSELETLVMKARKHLSSVVEYYEREGDPYERSRAFD